MNDTFSTHPPAMTNEGPVSSRVTESSTETSRSKKARDLFSGLPIEILHAIQFFLTTSQEPAPLDTFHNFLEVGERKALKHGWLRRFHDNKEAARKCILSKAFQQAWSTYPDLNFTDVVFSKLLLDDIPLDANQIQEASNARERFANYVLQTITRYQQDNIPLVSLRLTARIEDEEIANILEQSILKVREIGVKEVYLHMACVPPNLIQTIFDVVQLVSFNLFGCDLVNGNIQGGVKFSSLRILEFQLVTIDEELLQTLIHSCPLIEEMQLFHCDGPKTIKVADLSKLKKLEIFSVKEQIAEVNATNLEIMMYGHDEMGYLLNIESTQNLKILTLYMTYITDSEFHELIAKCPVLEELKLQTCQNLDKIKVSSNTLHCFSITYPGALQEATIDAPNLDLFEYAGAETRSFSFESGYSLKIRSCLTLDLEYLTDASSFLILSEFLMKFNRSDNSISLLIWLPNEISFDTNDLDELRDENNIPEFEEVNITVSPSSTSTPSMYAALMEGLLWSFSPKILSVKCDDKRVDEGFILYLSEELLLGENAARNGRLVKRGLLWRNYFARAKFEGRDEEWQPLHSWNSMKDVLENLGDKYVLKLSHA